MPDTSEFYKRLPIHHDFIAITNPRNYAPLPNDWSIIITDIVHSTKAIEEGRYKDVNTAGGLAAIAIANEVKSLDFPYIFGGDGVTMLLPTDVLPSVFDVLASTRNLCKSMFGLTLRVGVVSMKELAEQGFTLNLLKFRISDRASQAILLGSAVDEAESRIKNLATAEKYLLSNTYIPTREADFSGFLCSWIDIPSPKGETVSLIVKPRETSIEAVEARLHEVLTTIHRICGSEEEHHPLSVSNLSTTASIAAAERNALVFNLAHKNFRYMLDVIRVWGQNIILTFLPRKRTDFARQSIMADADFRKFDGSLKMVISCTSENRQRLAAYFAELHKQGVIAYGMHVADKALMTCFLQSPTSHIHFIDAANGGYALAAKQLKEQLQQFSAS